MSDGAARRTFAAACRTLRGTAWVLQQVVDEAERQYYDPSAIQGELARLAEQFDAGDIDEAEFDRREDELLERLQIMQNREQKQ